MSTPAWFMASQANSTRSSAAASAPSESREGLRWERTDKLAEAVTAADKAIDTLAFHDARAAVNDLVGVVNGYVSEQEPWKVAKDAGVKARLATILYTSAEVLRAVAVLHNPTMPKPAAKLWTTLLGAEAMLGPRMDQRVQDASTWGQLPAAPPSLRATPASPGWPEMLDGNTRGAGPAWNL